MLLVGFLVRVLMLKAVSSGAEERCAHVRLVTHTKYHTFDFDQGKCLPSGVIVVHCTHGINRTGYLVCK